MLVPVSMHKAEKYALDKKALTDEGLSFLMQNCGCARKVYNLYVSWLYDILEKQGFKPGDTIDVKLPEVTVFKKEFPFLKKADSLALANAKNDFSKARMKERGFSRSTLATDLRKMKSHVRKQLLFHPQGRKKSCLI